MQMAKHNEAYIGTGYLFTGIVQLKSSMTHTNKFEGGNLDEFLVEVVNIGELKKIK